MNISMHNTVEKMCAEVSAKFADFNADALRDSMVAYIGAHRHFMRREEFIKMVSNARTEANNG